MFRKRNLLDLIYFRVKKIRTRVPKKFLLLGIILSVFYVQNLVTQNDSSKNIQQITQNDQQYTKSASESTFNIENDYLQRSIENSEEYCEKNGDWYSMNRETFVKKSASYYFTDLKIISLNLLKTKIYENNFEVKIKVNFMLDGIYNSFVRYVERYSYYSVGTDHYAYRFFTLKINFDLKKEIFKQYSMTFSDHDILNHDLTIEVFMKDMLLEEKPSTSVKLKIKSLGYYSPKSDDVLICAKIAYLNDDFHYKTFKRWVDLNRKFGYKGLVVSKPPGYELKQDRLEYLDNNRDFIELKSMKCMPNILNQTHPKYFLSYDGSLDHYQIMDTLAFVSVAECFFENMDHYRYIQVFDEDELIYPYLIDEISFESKSFLDFYEKTIDISSFKELVSDKNEHLFSIDLENLPAKPKTINNFIENHKKELDLKATMIFYQKYFIENRIFCSFCDKLYEKMDTISLLNVSYVEVDIGVKNEHFWLFFSNQKNLLYSIYLCEIYNRVLEPSLKMSIVNADSIFNRIFTLSTYSSLKSIHDTNHILIAKSHFAVIRYYINELVKYETIDFQPFYEVSAQTYKHGHVAHFRPDQFKYLQDKKICIESVTVSLSHLVNILK